MTERINESNEINLIPEWLVLPRGLGRRLAEMVVGRNFEYNTQYYILVPVGQGHNLIQQIRVELSRMRKIIRDMGKVPLQFKILTNLEPKFNEETKEHYEVIAIRKVRGNQQHAQEIEKSLEGLIL